MPVKTVISYQSIYYGNILINKECVLMNLVCGKGHPGTKVFFSITAYECHW